MQTVFRARSAWCRCTLLLSLVAPSAVHAQNPPPEAGQQPASTNPPSAEAASDASKSPAKARLESSEEILVTGHYENAVGTSDAASQGRITRQLMEDRPILQPGELLELVPGLIITQHSGEGKANQYFLRGFNLDHGTDFATTLDGMQINMRTHGHGQGWTDLNFLIPELVQRVDYYKGPYFASKGDFASAGAADLHYAHSLPKYLAHFTLGSFGYGRMLLAGSPEVGGGKLLYGLELFHNDGPWNHADDYRRLNGVLRYSRQGGDASWDITAMGYSGTWNATDQIPQRAVQSGQIDRFGAIDPSDGGKSYRFSLSGDYRREVGAGVFQANVYAVRYKLNLFSDFTYFLSDPVNGDQFEQLDDRWLLGTSGRLTRVLQAGTIPVTGTVGWEGRYDRIDPVALFHTVARQRMATVRRDFVRETSAALFSEAEAKLTSWLRVTAGVRYDQYFFAVTSDNPVNSGRDSAGRISPKASAIFGPWAKTEFFANFGLGFHSNDARGVTTTVDPASGTPVSKVTPLVGSRGYEAGVRSEILSNVQASLALWRLELDSELLFTGDAGTTEPSRASRRQGIEFNAQWHPIRWLIVDLDVALSRARFTSPGPDLAVPGDHIPGAIGSAVSAGVTMHELGPLSASVYTRYFGPRPLIENDSVRSTSSTIFNVQASYRITEWLRLTGDVFNLFGARVDDIQYFYTSRLRGEPAAGVDDIHFHPAEKRSARFTAALIF
jgi:outer membrane receptor protein involved in Fe transport